MDEFLSKDGGKIAPELLDRLLTRTVPGLVPPQLLAGSDSSDDAAVYQISDTQAIVATTGFFAPIVDDPYHFGQIAGACALSNIYAMGATPLFALAVLGMPGDALPLEKVRRILEGGENICDAARIPLAGGHSIISSDLIYGLVVIGIVHPDRVKRNYGARPGDKLVLGKSLGTGICFTAAHRKRLKTHDYQTLLQAVTQLNTPGPAFACLDEVHAMTDITGFGLLRHLWEVCSASNVAARIDFDHLPLLPGTREFARDSGFEGAAMRNWDACAKHVKLTERLGMPELAILNDPQTGGGLLVSCAPSAVTEVLSGFLQYGFERASVIGEMLDSTPRIAVR